jgi:putative ABC transport system permease protein
MDRKEIMFKYDFFICALREIMRNKLRSILVFLSYFFTVFILLFMGVFVVFSNVQQRAIIGTTGTHFVTWLPSCGDLASLTEEELAKLAKGIIPEKCLENCSNCTGCNKKPRDILNEGFVINTNTTRLSSFDLVKQIGDLPEVKNASPFLLFRFRDPETSKLFTVGGMFYRDLAVQTNSCSEDEVIAGVYLNDEAKGKVLVDDGYAVNHGLNLGDKVVISEEEFEIIGIVASGADPAKGDFYMLFEEAERVISRRLHNPLEKEANIILVESHNGTVHTTAMEKTMALMQNDSLMTSGCYYPAAKAMGLSDNLLKAFLYVVLFTGVVFVIKIQYSSVLERRKDIAILKALGWKNRSVALQIMSESYILAILGILLSLIIMAIILWLVPMSSMWGTGLEMTGEIDIFALVGLFMGVMVFGVLSAGLASFIPLFVILRQRPTEILRTL